MALHALHVCPDASRLRLRTLAGHNTGRHTTSKTMVIGCPFTSSATYALPATLLAADGIGVGRGARTLEGSHRFGAHAAAWVSAIVIAAHVRLLASLSCMASHCKEGARIGRANMHVRLHGCMQRHAIQDDTTHNKTIGCTCITRSQSVVSTPPSTTKEACVHFLQRSSCQPKTTYNRHRNTETQQSQQHETNKGRQSRLPAITLLHIVHRSATAPKTNHDACQATERSDHND